MDSTELQSLITQSRLGGRGIAPQQNPVVAPPTASAQPAMPPSKPAEAIPSPTGIDFSQLYNDRQKGMASISEQAKKAELELKAAHEEKIGQTKEALKDYAKASMTPHPPSPTDIPEPPLPNIEPRQYLSGEGKNALRQAVQGISTLVTAFYGMSSPLAALNSLTGAMDGWHQGDMERAQREFQKYQMELEKVQRKNERAMKEWQIARVERTDDMEMQKALLQARLSAADLPVMAAQVSEHGVDRSLKIWESADQSIKKMRDQENKIIHQQLEFARQKQLDHSRSLTDQINQMKIKSGSISLTDQAVEGSAERLVDGDLDAIRNISRGIQGPEDLRKIINRAYAMAADRGIPPAQIAANVAELQAFKASQRVLSTREVNIDAAITEAEKLIPPMLKTSSDVPRSSWPIINKLLRNMNLNTPLDTKTSAAWKKFDTAVNSFIPVYARALKGAGVVDVASTEHARDLIETVSNDAQFKAVMDQLLIEMKAAKESPNEVRQKITNEFINRHQKKNTRIDASEEFSSMQKQSQLDAGKELKKSNKSQPSLKELLEKYK